MRHGLAELRNRLGLRAYHVEPRLELWRPTQVAAVVRAVVLVLCFALCLITTERTTALSWYPVLIGLAVVSSIRQWTRTGTRIVTTISVLGCVLAVLRSGGAASPLFPYLIPPVFSGGLLAGLSGAILPAAAATVALVVGSIVMSQGASFGTASAEWVVLAFAAGLAAVWLRVRLPPTGRLREQVDTSYAAAYRLLAELRPVARQLSVGLDPVTIAEGLLQSLTHIYAPERAAVYVRSGGGRLVRLAHLGSDPPEWAVDVTQDGPFAEAWASQRHRRLTRQLSGPSGSALIIPLVIGLRTFGVVGLETQERTLGPQDAEDIAGVVEEASLRLETALLFDEVRGLATAEERRRLAREIHDGIAQELASLGYAVDGMSAEANADRTVDLSGSLRRLRAEITRLVSELRMSIFDLRTEVDTHGGLGAALAEYVRLVGRQSALTVHVSLSESDIRLPADIEAELLRIAQEAVTNCRKHAGAANLWVTLTVDPPNALLRVEDDGRGLSRARDDSYGLQIMAERAKRLRTKLRVEPRNPRGTLVEVKIPHDDGRASAVTSSTGGANRAEESPDRR